MDGGHQDVTQNDSPTPDSPTDGPNMACTGDNGTLGTVSVAANNAMFVSPFDAVPSSDGLTVYFTAIDGVSGTGGVYKSTGGNVTPLAVGMGLTAPFGIAITPDDKTLYVADVSAAVDDTHDHGRIFTVSTSGGMPTPVAGADNYSERSVEVSAAGTVYFTGANALNGTPGLFKIAGGSATVVAMGAPFVDPSGIAVTKDDSTVYVLDTLAGPTMLAQVIKVTGGAATVVAKEIPVGYPGGIALSTDESAVLVSGYDPAKSTDAIYRIDLATQTPTPMSKGIDKFAEPAGLHRSSGGCTYAWADSLANATGTVFTLTK